MANPLTLLTSFFNGQGAGAQAYETYAEDHDSNYVAIQTTVNALVEEVKAFGGQNASLILDIFRSSSPAISVGFIGAESFPTAFLTANTQLQIGVGVALATGRISHGTVDVFTGTGSSGLRYFALQEDGTVTQETSSAQGALDLYSVNWNGSSFDTGTLTRLPTAGDVMVDGDDLQNCRIQENTGQGTSSGIPAFTYDRIAERLSDISRILTGMASGGTRTSADADQGALHPIAIGGAAATPGVVLGDGTTYDATTGLFGNPSSKYLGVAVEGIELARFDLVTASNPQALLRTGTSLSAPPHGFIGDEDTGIGYVAGNQFRAIAGALATMTWENNGGNARASFVAGSEANPGLGPIGDNDTGFHSPGGDQISLSIGGSDASVWNAAGQRTSASQGRVSASNATFSVANNSITAVNLTTEQYDQGTFHDNVTNPDRFTVPTNFDGNYSIKATVTFDESTSGGTPNAGDRGVQITLNGTAVAESRTPAAGAGDSALCVAIDLDLVATDIVRVTAFQDSGGSMDVGARMTARLED